MVEILNGENISKMGWKLIRIQKALKAFKLFGYTTVKGDLWFGADEKPIKKGKNKSAKNMPTTHHKEYSWRGVTEAIVERAGVKWDEKYITDTSERIRQFIEGVALKEGRGKNAKVIGRNYPVPNAERMAAIERFLTYFDPEDPDHSKPLVSDHYLTEYSPDLQAPLHLLEFLKDNTGSKCYLTPDVINGDYVALHDTGSYMSRYVLNMTVEKPGGPVKTHFIEEQFESDEIPIDKELLLDIENIQLKADPIAYFGWGVMTPEDTLLLFFNNLANEENHLFLTLSVDSGIYDDDPKPVQKMVTLNHSVPLEIDGSITTDAVLIAAQVAENVKQNLITFQRL